jgi:exodeoxyribonuclease V beta subunit
MADAEFGTGIRYEPVRPVAERRTSRLEGLRPLELIDVGQGRLEEAAVAKVHELLTTPCIPGGPPRPFRPDECCVLCRTNRIGTAIAEKLRLLGIPAVTTGTASVMAGQTAEDLRLLLEAMARPSDAGRARRAAATAFFGRRLTEAAALGDEEQQAIQERLALWHVALARRGVAAMAGEIMADKEVAPRLAAGRAGERRIVDFAHIVELLHEAGGGRGAPARVVLEHFATLATKEETSELVSRRVESDEDAVRIMTVHAAKGLQFPAVVVVDRWFAKDAARQRGAAVFYADRERRLDVGLAIKGIGTSAVAKTTLTAAENEELRRLMYVAITRPQHHVAILRTAGWEDSLLAALLPNAPATAADIPENLRDTMAVRPAGALPQTARWTPPAPATQPAKPGLAIGPEGVEQTYRRTSFSDLKNAAARVTPNHHAPPGQGHDEVAPGARAGTATAVHDAGGADGAARVDETTGLERFAMADLPGGTAFGSTVHEIFERVAVGPGQSADEITTAVRQVVAESATSRQLRQRQEPLVEMIVASLLTPFGGPPEAAFRDLRFIDFGTADRLVEMDFEMGVADIGRGVLASDVGRVLGRFLPADDPLRDYARLLAGESFDVPLAGLINGQIDAVLRLPGRPADDPRLLIADYKTNRLHRAEDARPLAAYAPRRLVEAMAHAHYPLQAVVYGTAVWRMLRWRLAARKPAGWDPGECLAGVVYGFVRGMQGAATPVNAEGRRYGVFTWQPPAAVWRRLSDLLAGDLTGVRP